MKKLNWLFVAACLSIMSVFYSCDDNDGYSIGDVGVDWATVRVTGNAFYLNGDTWGTSWPVNLDLGWYEPVDGQRVIAVFNPIYDNYQGYDHAIKITYLRNVLTKSVEKMTPENEAEYGNDPIRINKGDIALGGGYMNILFYQNLPAKTKHRISLVQNESANNPADGYLHLELRYNDYDDLTGYYASGLVSFNLGGLDSGKDIKGIKLKMNSIVNGEVEVILDKNSKEISRAITDQDFSKMRLK